MNTIDELFNDANILRGNKKHKIEQLENKIDHLQTKINKLEKIDTSFHALIYTPLAKAICEKMNIKYYSIYGPFGLNAELSIYFSNYPVKESKSNKIGIETNIEITKVETYSLDMIINYNKIWYWNGQMTNDYPKNSIGYYNGFNKVRVELPNTIDEIVKILQYNNPS